MVTRTVEQDQNLISVTHDDRNATDIDCLCRVVLNSFYQENNLVVIDKEIELCRSRDFHRSSFVTLKIRHACHLFKIDDDKQ